MCLAGNLLVLNVHLTRVARHNGTQGLWGHIKVVATRLCCCHTPVPTLQEVEEDVEKMVQQHKEVMQQHDDVMQQQHPQCTAPPSQQNNSFTYILCLQANLQGGACGACIHHQHRHRARLACVSTAGILATAGAHASQRVALAAVLLVVANGVVGCVGVGSAFPTPEQRALVVDGGIQGRVLGQVGGREGATAVLQAVAKAGGDGVVRGSGVAGSKPCHGGCGPAATP